MFILFVQILIPPFQTDLCDLFYLLRTSITLYQKKKNYSLFSSLDSFQLVLYGRENFYFSLLRGLFKDRLSTENQEQKFFIRKYHRPCVFVTRFIGFVAFPFICHFFFYTDSQNHTVSYKYNRTTFKHSI